MAMVLDAFAHYVGHMLTQLAADEVGTMLGVSGEINKMGDKLRDLNNFLADADRRNITDATVQEWVGQLKRAMYEATDILDLCQIKAMERGSSTLSAGCFNPLLFCMRNPLQAHEIGTRIKALNQRLDIIKERSAAFNFIHLESYEDRSSKVHTSGQGNPSRETSGELDRWGLVGEQIEEDTRRLVGDILQPREEADNNIVVIAIIGVGGIGKTTLAQKVFNDEAIQCEFSKKIWLSVNQNFSEIEMLKRAIIEAGGDAHPTGNAKATLHRALKDVLIGHKTLFVMDDVWDHGAWDRVLKMPFVNSAASGSRVLLTTRDKGVARGMTATWPYHHIDTLGPEDAWSLLKKQVITIVDEDHINTLEDIGLKLIQKCGGLPLAIKVMGGLLRNCGDLRRDWEQVLDDSKWSITKMPQELNYAVYLSYEYMPPDLKQCFLYYSFLPKSIEYSPDKVVAMWLSEGFIHGNCSDLEELGRNYYKELISRNLIEPETPYVTPWICSMHDVVRSFAQYMAKDEAFITDSRDNDIPTKLSSQKFLRLSIETDGLETGELDWKSIKGQQSVRTLISTIQIKVTPGDSFLTFSSLRTLHIESENMVSLVESLHQLKHLRYLKLVDSHISILPGNIGKMKLLQFLDLVGCKKLANLPNSILRLGQLRSLELPRVSTIPRGFRGLTNMRRLDEFRAHMDGGDWCSLDELGYLYQLRHLTIHELENVYAPSFAANARLGEKMHLVELLLGCTSRLGHDGFVNEKENTPEEEQRRIEKVFEELYPPPCVEYLVISGYFGQQFPSWIMSMPMTPLKNLQFLLISDLACCTQLPNGLCQLPYLQVLGVHCAPCIRQTLSSCMVDAQGFDSLYKMRRSTFSYVCSLVRIPFFEDMLSRDHTFTFVDGKLLSLQDIVAVALRVLNSGDSPVTVFVEAMWERAYHHISWPGSTKMEKIKHKFDEVHGLPNCCGVVQTAHITFGSQSGDHEENDNMVMQAMVDPYMRFRNIWLGPSGSMKSSLFKSCQEGTVLNGSKLKLSDGLEVGEYIIGDAGYPLLPWLLTPYHLEDKDHSADVPPYQSEFNRRHSSASTIMMAALTRLKDTWKILDRALGSYPPYQTIYVCCMLHNIVIDVLGNYNKHMRRLADEDAVRTRDILSGT
nr:NBS-LRR disease resistance protein [Dasypyrum villosum]